MFTRWSLVRTGRRAGPAASLVVACLVVACSSPAPSTSAPPTPPALAGGTVGPPAIGAATPSPALARWRPGLGDTFQVQYSGAPDLSVPATVYDLDADETPASTVDALHAAGRHVLCYVDAGSWESYRADAAAFPAAVLGRTMAGWPDERWLDIRRIDLLSAPLLARLDACAVKGFDGVDPDNLDGYANDTGFALTAADQLRFNRWLAAEAHSRGLAVVLKNDGEQAAALGPHFDAAVVEQCVEFDECRLYEPFVAAGKPVFDIEYSTAPATFCPVASRLGFEIVLKRLELDAYRETCPG